MTRVKRGVMASKRRKNLLALAKGYRWRRKNTFRAAKQAVIKAGMYAYRDRRTKKRVMRKLWTKRLNNAVRLFGISYSRFVGMLKTKSVEIDRKILSTMAIEQPTMFAKLLEEIKK